MPPIKSLLQREGRGIFDDKGKLGDRKKLAKQEAAAQALGAAAAAATQKKPFEAKPALKSGKAVPSAPPAKAAKVEPSKVVSVKPESAKSPPPKLGLAPRMAAPDPQVLNEWGDALSGAKPAALAKAAKGIEELVEARPDALIPLIDHFVDHISSANKKVVQICSLALPAMAKLQPARVAKHLPLMTERFAMTTEAGKDGFVGTFAALCTASVAYQKRLEPVLELALSTADAKTLERWTNLVLPSLKGEPHARARAVVESRLYKIPRATAHSIATFLGIKLRPQP